MPDCPECAQGKHPNCTVDVLNLDTEASEPCACAARDHQPKPPPNRGFANGGIGHSPE